MRTAGSTFARTSAYTRGRVRFSNSAISLAVRSILFTSLENSSTHAPSGIYRKYRARLAANRSFRLLTADGVSGVAHVLESPAVVEDRGGRPDVQSHREWC